MFRIAIYMLLATASVIFVNSGASRLLGQEVKVEPNTYLDKLRAERDQIQKNQQERSKTVKPGTPDLEILNAVKIYDYQIQNAEELIANGGEFGEVEYDKAMEAIQEEYKKNADRYLAATNDRFKNQIKDAQSQFAKDMAANNERHKKATIENFQKFQRSRDQSDLTFKFRTNTGKISMVLWNLPMDQNLHERLSTIANVQLFNGQQVVWNRKGLKFSTKEARNELQLPRVMFDRVVIEITRWKGEGCGLAEVEVFLGEENIALKRPCEVSSLETLPMHLDDQHALTDGITEPTTLGEGYWIPEEKTKSTVTIQLLGQKVGPITLDSLPLR